MANSTIEILINNIKHFRSLKNLTQEKLSEISGISKDYLSEIERLIKIAEALDIDVYKFFIRN